MFDFLKSSTGSGNLSLTIKGILIALVPVVIFIGSQLGVSLAEADILQVIETITTWVAATTILAGLGRKAWYWWKNR